MISLTYLSAFLSHLFSAFLFISSCLACHSPRCFYSGSWFDKSHSSFTRLSTSKLRTIKAVDTEQCIFFPILSSQFSSVSLHVGGCSLKLPSPTKHNYIHSEHYFRSRCKNCANLILHEGRNTCVGVGVDVTFLAEVSNTKLPPSARCMNTWHVCKCVRVWLKMGTPPVLQMWTWQVY